MRAPVLFHGMVAVPQGPWHSVPVLIPVEAQHPGMGIRLTMDADPCPPGTTTMTLAISRDGGRTYQSASMDCINPAPWPESMEHTWWLRYALSDTEQADVVSYHISAPAAFMTVVTLEVC